MYICDTSDFDHVRRDHKHSGGISMQLSNTIKADNICYTSADKSF